VKTIICLLVLISLIPVASWASANDGKGKQRNGPPPEAIEACEGKEVGDSVGFTGRRGKTLTATCEERNGQLVAVPEGRGERKKQR
jgi:hypothetical protein